MKAVHVGDHDYPLIALNFSGISPSVTGHWNTVLQWHTAYTLEEVASVLESVWLETQNGLEAVGWLSYEVASLFEPAYTLHAGEQPAGLPLAVFGIVHPEQRSSLSAAFTGMEPSSFTDPAWFSSLDKASFEHQLTEIQEAIRSGETYQVNLTHGLSATYNDHPWLWYQRLINEQQAGFSAFIHTEQGAVLSFSPELFFSWDRLHGTVTTRPMKGTVARAPDAKGDRERAAWLKKSVKNQAENVMIVDLLRNDLSKIASHVAVPKLFELERYATVWQMTSTIVGNIPSDCRWIEVLKALFPCGSIVGAPKLKTAEHIARHESAPRGVYCGAIAWISQNQAIFNVPIRTIQWNKNTHQAYYGVGNGLTIDSDAEEEWREIQAKCRFLSQKTPKQWALFETLLWTPDTGLRLLPEHLDRLCESAEYWNWVACSHIEHLKQVITQQLLSIERKEAWRTARRVKVMLQSMRYSPEKSRLKTDYNSFLPVPFERLSLTIETVEWDWRLPEKPYEVTLAHRPISMEEDRRFLCHKTTHRPIYDEARDHKPEWAWDIILWNHKGELTEFSFGNLALEWEGCWYTPPVSSGLLPGIARRKALETGQLIERTCSVDMLSQATRIAFLNSLRGWVPVCYRERTNKETV